MCLTPLLLAIVFSNLSYTVVKACTVNVFQHGERSGSQYGLWAFNHDDVSCASNDDQAKFNKDEWVTVSASKNGHNTIQTVVRVIETCKVDWNGKTKCDWNHVNFNTCDGITQASACSGSQVFKTSCDSYYVFYPEGQKSFCKAVVDDNGDPILKNGKPYGDCENCHVQDQCVRRLLRGWIGILPFWLCHLSFQKKITETSYSFKQSDFVTYSVYRDIKISTHTQYDEIDVIFSLHL